MKILHVMRTYGVHGGEQQLSQLFSLGAQSSIRETFVFLFHDPLCAHFFAERAPRLGQQVLLRRPARTGAAWFEFMRLLPRLPLLQSRFWRLITRERPQVCVAHGFQAALVAWPAAMLRRRIRWVYVHRTTKASVRIRSVFQLLYRPFDAVAGNSQSVTASLAPFTESEKLVALDNGIDIRRFDARAMSTPDALLPDSPGKVVVSVGRLLPQKGHALLIDAFAIAAQSHPLISLWIVGDGQERAELARRIAATGLGSRVYLLGYRRDVPAVLARADVFVNTSVWEGLSNAVLEGMAARLPSVVVDAPGVTECHVNGQTGLVVESKAEALAAALICLLTEHETAARMAAAARTHVERQYSMEANRARYDALFSKLTGSSN